MVLDKNSPTPALHSPWHVDPDPRQGHPKPKKHRGLGTGMQERCWHESRGQNGQLGLGIHHGEGQTDQDTPKQTMKIRIYLRPLHRILPGNAAGWGPAVRGPGGLWLQGRLKPYSCSISSSTANEVALGTPVSAES